MSEYVALDSTKFDNFADLLAYEIKHFDADAIADYIDEKENGGARNSSIGVHSS